MDDLNKKIKFFDDIIYYLEQTKKNNTQISDFNQFEQTTEKYFKGQYPNNLEYYFIFKYGEKKLSTASRGIEDLIENLSFLKSYSEDTIFGKKVNKYVVEIKNRILTLLLDYEELEKNKFELNGFEMWEANIENFIKDKNFKINYNKQFIEISNKKDRPRVLIAQYYRNFLVKILSTLLKNREKIINKSMVNLNKSKMRCFLTSKPECNKDMELHSNWVFQAYDTSDGITKKALSEINEALNGFDLIPKPADKNISNKDFMCKICQMIQESEYFLADLTGFNNNVILETGMAFGMSKNVFIISRDNSEKFSNEISDLKRSEILFYDKDKLDNLKYNFQILLRNIIEK
jgi:hypothetical protein